VADYYDVDTEYWAFGLAGECVVYFLEAKQEKNPVKRDELIARSNKSKEDLSRLAPQGLDPDTLVKKLKDQQMVQAIGNVLVSQKKDETSDAWSKWLESHFHDEPATGQP